VRALAVKPRGLPVPLKTAAVASGPVMHFYSGKPMHFCSGVDTRLVSQNYRGTSVGPVTVAGVPFALSLHRFQPPVIPCLHFQIRHTITNGEELRKERIQDAIEKKFPKLAGWKRDHNAKTVLVLEQNDIQLTAPDLVADAYVPLAKTRADRPDETYLVVSCMTPWHAWPILIGDKAYLELVRSGEAEFEGIDPTELRSLTRSAQPSSP
jgi:hypothetical protein